MKKGTNNRISCRLTGLVAFAAVAMMAAPAFASVPVTMTQQGRLLDDGEPLTGSQTLEFALYDSATGGDLLWSDELSTDLDDAGVYSVELGSESNPIDANVLQDGEVYLGLTVNGEAFATRTPLTSVPFAALAQSASIAHAVADGAITSNALAPGAVTSSAIDSVNWDQIAGVPSSVTESSDTLAELSCAADQVALYDGSSWACGDLPDQMSYSAGDGLNLSSGEFSLDDSAVVNCASGNCPVASGNAIYFDGDTDGDFSIGKRVFCLINPITGDSNCLEPWLAADSTLIVNGRLQTNDELQTESDALIGGDVRTSGDVVLDVPEDNLSYVRFRPSGARLYHNHGASRLYARGAGEFRFGFSSILISDPMDLRVYGEVIETSDERIKEDAQRLDSVLAGVLDLRPMRYRLIDENREREMTMGFMAQDVKRVFPEAVSFDEESEIYGLKYSTFSVLAIQAIQEQQEVIESQDRKIDYLEDQLQAMDERLQRLESQR